MHWVRFLQNIDHAGWNVPVRLAERIDPSNMMTMMIHTASSHGFQTRIEAHLTRTVRVWNTNLDASLNNISSSVSPSRASLSLINAKPMNITSIQDDPDCASTHAGLDISNALPQTHFHHHLHSHIHPLRLPSSLLTAISPRSDPTYLLPSSPTILLTMDSTPGSEHLYSKKRLG